MIVKIFGESRLAYVLGLVNLYLVTSFAMVYVLAKKVSKAPKIAAVISLMICPSMVFLTFNGFVDIGGLLGCLVCFNLYFVKDKDDDAIWRYAVIGVLLVALMLWRRWYAFFSTNDKTN